MPFHAHLYLVISCSEPFPVPLKETGGKITVKMILKPFSVECRKTKTIAITLMCHNKRKPYNKPISMRSDDMLPVQSAGKYARASHDWF